jgi:hypothetical protein
LERFKHNYQHLISKMNELQSNPQVNSFSLHLIALLSHSLIQYHGLQ